MNLLKSLNAKTKAREMLLVDCATKRGSVDHQLRKIRTHRRKGFWAMVVQGTLLLSCFLLLVIEDINLGETYFLFFALAGVAAYQWEVSDRKIQLLLLIKHYREED